MLLGSTSLGAALTLLIALPGTQSEQSRPATPSILPQASIRGVGLGMTPAEVRAAAGGPAASGIAPNPILGRVRIWRYPGLRIMFDSVRAGRTVIAVATTSRRDRTAEGVGVGSREDSVQRLIRGVRCEKRYGYRTCSIGGERAGETATDFAIAHARRVTRVTLARVID